MMVWLVKVNLGNLGYIGKVRLGHFDTLAKKRSSFLDLATG
jgi:hypothetical protein